MFANVSAGADTKANAWAAAAHPRLSIFVCGRISTSLSRPDMSLPLLVSLLSPKLQARGGVGAVRDQECQRGADIKANAFGAGGALERGHGAPLEPLAQLGDALGGVGATALPVEAAELVFVQAAMSGARMVREEFMIDRVTHCQRALTQKQTRGRRRLTSAKSRRSP